MKNKHYLVYQIINKINNMIYIGVHVTENKNDNYMGSGTNIRKAIKLLGMHNFEKIILYQFNNEKDMLVKEAELVNEEFIARPDTYNIILGGGTFLTTDCVPVKDKNGNNMLVHKTDPRYLSGELVSNMKGSFTAIDKNGNCFNILKNDPRYLSGELKHITKGMIVVKDKNDNYYSVHKTDPRYLSGEFIGSFKNRKHSKHTKKLMSIKAKAINKTKDKNPSYGKCWIHNLNLKQNLFIKRTELKKYSENNWILGRKQKWE